LSVRRRAQPDRRRARTDSRRAWLHLVCLLVLCAAPSLVAAQHRKRSRPSDARADALLGEARRALAAGRAWRASELLRPLVADSTHRRPDVVIVASSADLASGLSESAGALLRGAPWLDSALSGLGWLVLVKAELAQGADSAAAADAATALRALGDGRLRGAGLALRARALDRLDRRDSAAASYDQAARDLPDVADWLHLRAAGVTQHAPARRAEYAAVRSAAARARIPSTEALARERTGDIPGAIRAYDSLGAPASAQRLQLATARDSTARSAACRALLATARGRPGTADARNAVDILDRCTADLSPTEALAAGWAGAQNNVPARAVLPFERAFAAGVGADSDQLAYAQALTRVGRGRDAMPMLERLGSSTVAAPADFLRARLLVQAGQRRAARALLDTVRQRAGSDSVKANAFVLGADLAADDGEDAVARAFYDSALAEYPTHRLTPRAAFQRALLAYVDGAGAVGAREFDSLVASYPTSEEVSAAMYWSGRAWASAGARSRARARWSAVAARDPLSYYAALASQRLGRRAFAPPPPRDKPVAIPADVDSALARAALLDSLGMDVEARLEREWLGRSAATSLGAVAVARGLSRAGQLAQGSAVAARALDLGAPRTAALYRLIYPVWQPALVSSISRGQALEPPLVAAVIKQESNWVPTATSPAGARGLMQVEPDVGGEIAAHLKYRDWSPVLLYEPEANMEIGTRHLQQLASHWPDDARALAAYNAGAARVRRWNARGGVTDSELFTERIPFAETRDYVRIVLRNRLLYKSLYHW